MCAYVNFCYSVAKLCLTLSNPVNCSTPGFPILHCLPEFAQTHVHWVTNGYLILCHPLILPSISACYCIFPCNFQFLKAPYMLGIFLYVSAFNSQLERKQMLTMFSFFDHASLCSCVKKILRFKRRKKMKKYILKKHWEL